MAHINCTFSRSFGLFVMVDFCLNTFKGALREVNPCLSVQKALVIADDNLTVSQRRYALARNVHLVAIGKAAPAMVEGAEKVLGSHLVGGIASVPNGVSIPPNLKTKFFKGAEDNLPDQDALENARRIEEFVRRVRSQDQFIIFLISGGGSALLPATVPGVSLEEKVSLTRALQSHGADIKQLNVVRTALSRLKGGRLAKLGHPSKMISLIISDIVGDPLELISSGPTVVPEKLEDPLSVLKKLEISDEMLPSRVLDALKKVSLQRKEVANCSSSNSADILNMIIASNSILLDALARQISANSSAIPIIITNELEGNAAELGARFAKLIKRSLKERKLAREELADWFMNGTSRRKFGDESQFNRPSVVLLFGGESTVRFDGAKTGKDAKGGRNQELILSAFHQLANDPEFIASNRHAKFALFSMGSDGQDGPTDAAGAFISNSDLAHQSPDSSLASNIRDALDTKCSYRFWSEFNEGRNLVKTGKTGVNVMDVQMLFLDFQQRS